MPKTTKKILCTAVITAILNLSFQPVYAVKIEILNESTNHFITRPLMKDDPSMKFIKASAPAAQSWISEVVKEAGSYSFSALKALAQLPRLASKGIICAVQHPLEALTLGLATQVTMAGALKAKREIGDAVAINYRSSPTIASLTNGNVFVVWCDFINPGSNPDSNIYGRIFSARGVPLDNEFIINQYTEGNEYATPSIASLTNGDAFVTWQVRNFGQYSIYGRIVSENGTAFNDEFPINTITNIQLQYFPTVARLTDGNAFITWAYSSATENDIYGRIYSANGTALSDDFLINQAQLPTIYGDSENPFAVGLNNGNAFVLWYAGDIYGMICLPSGRPIGNEFYINQKTGSSSSFSAASLTNGNVFVAWQSVANIFPFPPYIAGRVFSANGTALDNEFQVDQTNTYEPTNPFVVSLENGNAFIVWSRCLIEGCTIMGQIFSPQGKPLNNNFLVSQQQYSSYDINPLSLARLINENVFVVWMGNQTKNDDIYGRIFSQNGTALCDEFIINQITTSSLNNKL